MYLACFGGSKMVLDEYWNKFTADGKIQSYLNYKEHLKSQESFKNDTESDNDRWFDNTRTTNR